MPVTTEQAPEKPARRRVGWLWAPVGLLALALLLIAVPLFRPVSLTVGSHVLMVGTQRLLPRHLTPRRLFYSFDIPAPPVGPGVYTTTVRDGRRYLIEGAMHGRFLVIGDRACYLQWFEGRPLSP